jgi:hypothetical protein
MGKLLLYLLLVSCGNGYSWLRAVDPEPEPVIVSAKGADLCGSACDRMAKLACQEASPILLKDGGVLTCEVFCAQQHQDGINWNTYCLSNITTCADIPACTP